MILGFFMGGGRGKWVGVAKHTLPQHPNLKLEHYYTFHSLILVVLPHKEAIV